ncbi:MAG: deoxyribodipyrimidine photo-lyase [Rhodanobacteraceae bacterium]
MRVGLVWFRRDLRLADNAALRAALDACDRVVPVFIHAPNEETPWQPGAASRWWLHHSLTALDDDLKKRAGALHVRRGASLRTLRALIRETGAQAVFWNRLYDPAIVARDRDVKAALLDDGVEAHSFGGALLFEPWELATGQNTPYKVFTPYWRQARSKLELRPPAPAPRKIESPRVAGGVSIGALKLLPKIPWDDGLLRAWTPGETGARTTLRTFLRGAIADYPTRRDIPAERGTSRLSAYLHFGEITPMQVAWAMHEAEHEHASAKRRESGEAYLRELGWREFSHHLLYHFPESAGANLNPKFDRFAWARTSPAQLAEWQRGRTGIPIVDAGLRELWATGWMHNRVRMLVASFFTKNLRQHWLDGARWFWDTLIDADLANNTQGWQWTAGTGADAAPYFRIFNPVTQGERFDPDGAYVRTWVRELRAYEGKSIHRPRDDPEKFAASGYPEPIVDLATTRDAALAAYAACK